MALAVLCRTMLETFPKPFAPWSWFMLQFQIRFVRSKLFVLLTLQFQPLGVVSANILGAVSFFEIICYVHSNVPRLSPVV